MPAFVILNSSCLYHVIKYAKICSHSFKAKFRTNREQNYFALWNTFRKGYFLMWFVQYFSRNDFRACLLVNTADRSNQLANMQIIHSRAICHAFPYVWFLRGWKWYFSKERFVSEFLFKLFDREKVLHNCNRQNIHVAETTCTPASAIFDIPVLKVIISPLFQRSRK